MTDQAANTPEETPQAEAETTAPPEVEAEQPAATPEPTPEVEAAPEAPAPKPAPAPRQKLKPGEWWWGLGRRKSAVARVRIRPGDGKFVVNKRPCEEYFTGERDRNDINNVLEKTSTKGKIDIYVNVKGGGYTGQAGAIVLGLGRAIKVYDSNLEPILRDNNFLTRDPRQVERKKYGQPGARKRFQFSKR